MAPHALVDLTDQVNIQPRACPLVRAKRNSLFQAHEDREQPWFRDSPDLSFHFQEVSTMAPNTLKLHPITSAIWA